MTIIDTTGRAGPVAAVAATLEPNPNLTGDAATIAHDAAALAASWLLVVPDGPELVVALRLLRQAKNGAVIARLFPPGGTGPEGLRS